MPITVITPTQGQVLGPGYQVQAFSDFVGPLPVNSYWDFDLRPATGEYQLSHARVYIQENQGNAVMGWNTGLAVGDFNLNVMTSTVKPGDTVRLVVKQVQAPSTILDQTTVDVVWEPTAGAPWVLQEQISRVSTGGGNGDLQIIKQSVSMDVGGGVIKGIIDTIGGLPPNFLQRDLIIPDRTGSGSLTRPAGNLTTAANGIAWEVVSSAPGIGIDEGAPDRFELVGLELRYVLTLSDGFTFTANHVATQEMFGAWPWGFVTPSRIDYYIVPGVTMRFSWLLPTGTPFWQGDPATLPFLHHPVAPIEIGRR